MALNQIISLIIMLTRRSLFFSFLLPVLSLHAQDKPAEQVVPPAEKSALRVMSYNLRYATSPLLPHSWVARREAVATVIRKAAPDLIGTQEGTWPQLKDMARDMPEYAWIGLGRDGGSGGEFMAIFYRQDRLEPLAFDHFWLSDTPSVMASSTWGNQNIRMVTWVRFADKVTGKEFYHWNTHLDHVSQEAREKAARLIIERVDALKTESPVILTGDFNASAKKNKVWNILTEEGGFTDQWEASAERVNETANSFNSFKPTKFDGNRIDWILTRTKVKSSKIEIILDTPKDVIPSDHNPVQAILTLGE